MNLIEAAKSYVKKDITSLEEIDLKTLEVKKQGFERNGQKGEYFYIEIDGWKYVVKAEILGLIKELLEVRPTTTKIRVKKNEAGELKVYPLD